MITYWILFAIIVFFSIKNWRKTVIVWIPLQLFFNECVCLKYTPPAVSFVLAVDFLLLIEYLIIVKKRRLVEEPYLFKTVFIVYLISYSISMIFSIVPFSEILTGTIKYFVQTFLVVFLFQKALKDFQDIKLFVNASFVVIIAIVILGLYESIMKDNPVLDYVYLYAPLELIKGKMYYVPPFISYTGDMQMRYGMVRAYSFFGIHIAFGCACVLLLYLYLYLFRHQHTCINNKKLMVGSILLIIGIFLCNSKTPIVGLFFFLLAFFSVRHFFNIKVLGFIIMLFILIFSCFPSVLDNFAALFDRKIAEDGGGSTTDLRIRQFEIAIHMFSQNPLFGNGIGSIDKLMSIGNNADILGSESSWMKILPERGLLGVLSYLVLYIQMWVKFKFTIGKKCLFFFLCGLMAMETATGFMNFALYGSILICIHRYMKIKTNARVTK